MRRSSAFIGRLFIIFIVAFAIRAGAGIWWQSRLESREAFFFGDSETYWSLARKIATGTPYAYGEHDFQVFRTPGYPVLLSPIFLWDDNPPVLVGRLFTALWGGLSVMAAGWLGGVLFGPRCGLLAASVAAFYPGSVAMGAFVLSEAPFCLAILMQLGSWVRASQSETRNSRWTWSLAAGFWAAAATLIRPSWLLFTPFAAAVNLGMSRNRRRHFAIGLITTTGLCVGMVPWWVRNFQTTGQAVLTTLQMGASLYDGWNPNADGSSDMAFVDGYIAEIQHDDPTASGVDLEMRLDRRLRDAALNWAQQNPGRVLELAKAKFLRLWSLSPNDEAFRNPLFNWIVTLTFIPILALGTFVFWRVRRMGSPVFLMALPAVYLTLLHVVFVSSLRYREPAMMFFIVLASGLYRRGRANDNSTDDDVANPMTEGGESVTFFEGIGRLWRSIRGLVLTAAAVAVAVTPFLWMKADDLVGRHVRSMLESAYPHLDIDVSETLVMEGEGLVVRGISIFGRDANKPDPLVHFREVFLACELNAKSLLKKNLQLGEIVIRQPVLRASRRADRTWSIDQLLPLPKLGDGRTPIRVEGARLELSDDAHPWRAPLVVENLDLSVIPQFKTNSIESSGGIKGADNSPPAAYRIVGRLSCPHARHAEFQARVSNVKNSWNLSGTVNGLHVEPELCAYAADFAERGDIVPGAVHADGLIDFYVDFDASRGEAALQFSLAGSLHDGNVDSPLLPTVVTNVEAEFVADQSGVRVEKLTGRGGESTIWMRGRLDGYARQSPWSIDGEIRDLRVNGNLLEALECHVFGLRERWYDFRPSGTIDATYHWSFDGSGYHPDVRVECRDVSFAYERFPYRVENGQGLIHWKEDNIRFDVNVLAGERNVTIRGDLVGPGSEGTSGVTVAGTGIPIDARLRAALKPEHRRILDDLRLHGHFDFTGVFRRGPQTNGQWKKEIRYSSQDLSVSHTRFPYAVSGIHGAVVMQDKVWLIGADEPLRGFNGSSQIAIQGATVAEADNETVELKVRGEQIPLDAELRAALNQRQQFAWDKVRPRGLVNADIELVYCPRSELCNSKITLMPADDSVSVKPEFFPYGFDRIDGEIILEDGRLRAKSLHGSHGATRISSGMNGVFPPDGNWYVEFPELRLRWDGRDQELIYAMPEGLKRALIQMDPQGSYTVSGKLAFAGATHSQEETTATWDLNIHMAQAALQCGVPLTNIWGAVHNLRGSAGSQSFQTSGELALDSIMYHGHQFTHAKGPLAIDDNGVHLGNFQSNDINEGSLRHLTANIYGGRVTGDAQIDFNAQPRYTLRGSLRNADLATFSREYVPGKQNLAGKVDANAVLQGRGDDVRQLAGRGDISIREADLYELPVMVSLLKFLNLRAPDTTAFTEGTAEFDVMGNRLVLRKIDFEGDVFSLQGTGEIDFDQRIDLTFGAVVGRDNLSLPGIREIWRGVRNVMGEANKQILPIRVEGTLRQPRPRLEPLSDFFDAMEQFQGDLRRTAEEGILPQAIQRWSSGSRSLH